MQFLRFFVLPAVLLFSVEMAQASTTIVTPDENGDIKYAPYERFAVPANKYTGLLGASNVVIKEVNYDGLPEFIMNQVNLLAKDCVGDERAARDLRFYRYTSDLTRDGGLSPNYLVDLASFADKEQKSCIVGQACEDGECYLVGYNSSAHEQWGLHFVIRQKSWKNFKEKDPKTDAELTLFDITSRKQCPDADRESSDKTCTAGHIWLDSGFVKHEVNPAEVAPPEVEPKKREDAETQE